MITWITPVAKSTATTGSYVDINASSDIPVGATGVILAVSFDGGANTAWAVRKNGSSDDRYFSATYESGITLAIVGVDANRIFEIKNERSSAYYFNIVGYTTDEAVLLTNAVNKTNAGNNAWYDIDVSGQIAGGDTAIAAIMELNNAKGYGYSYAGGYRANGSSDNRTGNLDGKVMQTMVVKLDTNKILESYRSASDIKFYIQGYFKATANLSIPGLNAVDISLSATAAYYDISLGSDKTGAFIEIHDGAGYAYALKRKGDTDMHSHYSKLQSHSFQGVGADASGIISGKISNTAINFYLLMYTTTGVTFIPQCLNII